MEFLIYSPLFTKYQARRPLQKVVWSKAGDETHTGYNLTSIIRHKLIPKELEITTLKDIIDMVFKEGFFVVKSLLLLANDV